MKINGILIVIEILFLLIILFGISKIIIAIDEIKSDITIIKQKIDEKVYMGLFEDY